MIVKYSVPQGDSLTLPFTLVDPQGRPLTSTRLDDDNSTFDLYYYNAGVKTYVLQNQKPVAQMSGTIRDAVTVSSITGELFPVVALPSDHLLPMETKQPVYIEGSSNAYLDDRWITASVVGPRTLRLDAQLPSTVTTMQITTGVLSITIPTASIAVQTGNVLRQYQVAYVNTTYDTTESLEATIPFDVWRVAS